LIDDSMDAPMRSRLSLLMALVYAVQGAFWPLLAIHLKDLGIEGRERGWIFATLAIGSLAMPLGAGRLVDRFFAGQRLLGLIFALASVLLVAIAAGLTSTAGSLFVLFLVFWLVTAPAFTLASAIALRHLARPYEQFPGVRLWGTVGWMAVGWFVSLVMAWSGSAQSGRGAFEAFWIGAGLAGILAVYSLSLPDTPPLLVDDRATPGLLDAIDLARRPGMSRFLITALCVSLTTPFVFQVLPPYLEARGLPRAWVSTVLTLAQWPEIVMLAILPWFFRQLGPKGTLATGIVAWAVRFTSLALDPPLWVAIAGIPLQGIGFACFTVAGQVYTDSQAPLDRRASAQALYMVVTSGIGALLGSLLAGDVLGRFAVDSALVFLVPCVIDSALIVYFCVGFAPNATTRECDGASNAARPVRPNAVRGTIARVGNLVTESADG
jgi:MFS family permease